MKDQRELELEYARLIQKRGELKGISNKEELLETKVWLFDVAKKLKQCTKKLTIVLKENPDLEGEKVS